MPTFSSRANTRGLKRGLVAAHRHHAHALGAAGDHHVGLADADAVGRHLDGGQARGAEAVDGDAAHACGSPPAPRRRAPCSCPARPRGWRSRRWRPRWPSGPALGTCASALRTAATSRSSGRVLRKKPRLRPADGRARGGNDVGVLNLFVMYGSSVAHRLAGGHHAHDAFLGLGVCDQRAEVLALQRHQVVLGDQRAGVDIAATDHLGDQAGRCGNRAG